MGQLITTIGGAALGFVLGGPFGAAIGASIGGAIGASLFAPTIEGPRLNDLKVSASTYGLVIPDLYGTCRIGANLIWSTGIKETKHTQRAGKGGPKQTSYTYDATFAIALCRGPIDNILRIWADSKLIYNKAAGLNSSFIPGSANFQTLTPPMFSALLQSSTTKHATTGKYTARFYMGDESQLPDSLIVADKGADNVSAMRGLAYIIFEKFQLADFANHIPSFTVEVSKQAADVVPSLVARQADGVTPFVKMTGNWPQWYPDWSHSRIFASDQTTTYVGNLDTMIMSGYHNNLPLKTTSSQAYPIGEADLMLVEVGGSNARTVEIYNMTTGALFAEFGKPALFWDTPSAVSGGACVKPLAYGSLYTFGHNFHTTPYGKSLIVAGFTWYRSVWFFRPGEELACGHAAARFSPTCVIPGRSGAQSCDVIAWANGGGLLYVDQFSVTADASGKVLDYPSCALQCQDVKRTDHTLDPWPGEPFAANVVLYDPSDNCIFALGNCYTVDSALDTRAFKYNLDTEQYVWRNKYAGSMPPPPSMQFSRIGGGTFGWWNGYFQKSFIQIDLTTGALVKKIDYVNTAWGEMFYANPTQFYDSETESLVMFTQNDYRRVFFRGGSGYLKVSDIVRDVCLKTRVLVDADIDVSGMNDDSVVGYTIDRQCTARDVIQQMASIHFFDGYESDYTLKFRSRGGTTAATITQDWLGRDVEHGNVLNETTTQELELAMRVTVNYYDYARNYQQGSQSAKRGTDPVPTMEARKEATLDIPIVLTADDAKQAADKALKMIWASRWTYDFQLPWRFLKYDPTDIVTIQMDSGRTYNIRLSAVNTGADFRMTVKGVSERGSAYVSTLTGSSGSGLPAQFIRNPYPAKPIVINTPLLRDLDYDTSGNAQCYVSISTKALAFDGAGIYMSSAANPNNYDLIGDIDSTAVTGMCFDALPPTTAYDSTDEHTVLRVQILNPNSELESVTMDEMLTDYANAAVVGDEVIQFRDAVLAADGLWHLTGILRARRGTNYAVNDHVVGEPFLLLKAGAIDVFSRAPEAYYTTRSFKAIPTDQAQDQAEAVGASLVPRDLMPYTPEDFAVTDDGTNVTINMSRRSRITAPLVDYIQYIIYREGNPASAKIVAEVYPGKGLSDIDAIIADGHTPPVGSYSVALFDSSGNDIDRPGISFPLATSTGDFLLKAYETGHVDGIPKWIEFHRLDEGRWNMATLY